MTKFDRDMFRLAFSAVPPTVLVAEALDHLRKARELLDMADAPKATDKVRSALKSAEGAQRNAIGKSYRKS